MTMMTDYGRQSSIMKDHQRQWKNNGKTMEKQWKNNGRLFPTIIKVVELKEDTFLVLETIQEYENSGKWVRM